MKRIQHTVLHGGALFILLGMVILSGAVSAAQARPAPRMVTAGTRARPTPSRTLHRWSELPAGLAPVVRRALGKTGAGSSIVRRVSDGYQAANVAAGLLARFTVAGPQISAISAAGERWDLQLVGYGRSQLGAVARARVIASGGEVTYERSGLSEWYRNGAQGLEQGFTLAARPAGPASVPVTLALRMTGTLRARLARGGVAVDLVGRDGVTVWRYGGLRAIDARGRTLAAHVAVRGNMLRVVVDDQRAAYPVRIDPVVQQAELRASAGAQEDVFGYSVALSADGSTALVGAMYKNNSFGAVYVFVHSGANWSQQAELAASDGAPSDHFGESVALNADGNTALIAAREKNGWTGAAYIFVRSDTCWIQQAELTANDGTQGDFFGSSVALSADGSTALIGAFGRSGRSGALYTFARSGVAWNQQAVLIPDDGRQDGDFGLWVALSADGNTAITTGNTETHGVSAMYVFVRSGASWGPQAELTNSDAAAGFGSSVAMSADGSTALIGASAENTYTGEAYVFVRSDTSWSQQAVLIASDGATWDLFGGSVALNGDGNIALIGAYGRNVNTGAAYVFMRSGAGWSQQGELTAGDQRSQNWFAYSLASALSGDGHTALIGAYGQNNYTGAAYVFDLTGLVVPATPTINWPALADITYGTGLGTTQLDATATDPSTGQVVRGTFTYTLGDGTTPVLGAVLPAGQGQTLKVSFTPDDTADYTSATGSTTINVNPAPLTITPDNQTMTYGGTVPFFTVRPSGYSGLVNGDAPSVVSGVVCGAVDANGNPITSQSPAGIYAITCRGGIAANYSISYVPGTLTIRLFVPGSLLALSQDGGSCHLLLNGGATVTAGTAAVNGTSASALCLNGGAGLSAGGIVVQGGVRNNHGTVQGTLQTQQPATADALAGLSAPTAPGAACPGAACPDGTNLNGGHTYRLLPGSYTQTINVNGGATVCVAPGVYVLQASWNVNAALRPYGSAGCPVLPAGTSDPGVLLYFAQGHVQVNGSGDESQLLAMQSGPYAGLLYWQADGESTALNGSAGFAGGGWYEPRGALILNGGTRLTAPYVAAAMIAVNGGASLSVAAS